MGASVISIYTTKPEQDTELLAGADGPFPHFALVE